MTADEIRDYLEENGYPRHVVRGGAEGLIARWQDFVKEVEAGYRYRLEDYRHDLDLRGVIQTVGLEGDTRVHQADERLWPLLTEKHVRVWESLAGEPFWDFGYPRNASRELMRDLKAAGLSST
jgi:hypothetical protein